MATIRFRAQARATLSVGVIFLGSLMAVPAALATPAPVVPRTEPSLDQPGVSVSRRSDARFRGHVEVGKIAGRTRGGNAPLGMPVQERSAVVPTNIDAAPPVDPGTTNATTAPSLVKLGLTTGSASLPNPIVAAGPDHVIRSDDGELLITNRSGGAATTVTYADLFLLPEDTESLQGQVYFDPAHGRWLAVEASRDCVPGDGPPDGHGNLDFAVSNSANPLGGWTIYYYPFSDDLVWEPRLGSSANKLVLTAQYQHIGPDCLTTGTHAFVATTISWAELLGGDFEETQFVFEAGAARRLDQLTPAIRRDGRSNTLELMAQVFSTVSQTYETWLYRITGPGANASIAGVDLAGVVPPVGAPDPVPQGNEGLFFFPWWGPTSLVAQDDRLAASLTEDCTPPGDSTERTCARIIDLGTSPNIPTRLQDFYISRNGKYVFSPGLAFSENDELIITFQRASQNEGPSSFVVRQSPTDGQNSVSATRSLATPLGLYTGDVAGAEMIGLSPDPLVPDAVWVINQAGKSADPAAYSLQVAQARTAIGDTYIPITPVRVLDTRTTPGNIEDFFWDSIPKTIAVAGEGTIPTNAVAITGNLTVVLQSSDGYVSLGPTVSANPTSSTINFPMNEDRANNLTLPLNGDGDLRAVYKGGAGKATGLILDVTGYFLSDDSGDTYEPITSARVLDTRFGTGLSGRFVINAPRTFQVTGVGGVGGVPAGATAVTGNLTVVGQSRAGYVSLTPTPTPTPTRQQSTSRSGTPGPTG